MERDAGKAIPCVVEEHRILGHLQMRLKRRKVRDKLIASVMAALAEFERDLLRERIRSTLSPRPRRAPIQVYLPN